jgi:hypothetical protein
MEGGRHSIDDMIRSTVRGLLVSRLWYICEVDPYQKLVPGMNRDGTGRPASPNPDEKSVQAKSLQPTSVTRNGREPRLLPFI